MNKTEFQRAPTTAEEMLAWMRTVKVTDPVPPNLMWRLLILIRYLDKRLTDHEQAMLDAIASPIQLQPPVDKP